MLSEILQLKFIGSFILGMLTPFGAVCVLPLYPGYLSYLATNLSKKKIVPHAIPKLGFLVALGIITFMSLFGLIFSTFLELSLSKIINIISPIAFTILFIISFLLVFNFDFSKLIPSFSGPIFSNPKLSAFFFGFFFGIIVLPCNPLFIALMFAKRSLVTDFLLNIIEFIFFGLGMSIPIIIFSILPQLKSKIVINGFVKYKNKINVVSGLIMMIISIYYLLFVFNILRLF